MAVSFATMARKQIAAEKRAAKELHLVARATFKATNATLYAIRSQDKIYHVTVCAGRVTSCIDSTTGDPCKGRAFTGKCKHGNFAMQFESENGALEAKRQEELAVAEAVAPLIVGELFADELHVHLDDEFSAQPEPADQVYGALTFGAMVRIVELARRLGMSEQAVRGILAEMVEGGRIVAREMAEGMYWVDTPEQAYRAVFYGDFAA